MELEETEVCEQLKFTPNDILVKRDIDFINSIKYPEKYKNNTKFWNEYTREEKSDLIMKYIKEILFMVKKQRNLLIILMQLNPSLQKNFGKNAKFKRRRTKEAFKEN